MNNVFKFGLVFTQTICSKFSVFGKKIPFNLNLFFLAICNDLISFLKKADSVELILKKQFLISTEFFER